MWEELGISGGTAIIILIALYFIVKWAVKNGVKEAYRDINENRGTDAVLHGLAEKIFEEEKTKSKDTDINI
ncbi:MAG: hypothetical protein HFE90_01215 [Firmicutes bacterium]|nr:hypothetical protein [Bacillota bacterium]